MLQRAIRIEPLLVVFVFGCCRIDRVIGSKREKLASASLTPNVLACSIDHI